MSHNDINITGFNAVDDKTSYMNNSNPIVVGFLKIIRDWVLVRLIGFSKGSSGRNKNILSLVFSN